jgi:hypothetical protein
MNHKQKGIIVRLSDEEFHALNEKVEMSGLPRQTYVRKLIHGVMPDGKISEEWHTVFRTLDLIRNHIHLLILFGAGENFEIYNATEIWYFVPEERRSAVDWYMASMILRDEAAET